MSKVVEKISIINKAKEYGFKVRGNKAVCLFHNDTDPSLCFDDINGLWYCHGCAEGGNLIDFIANCKLNKLEKKK